MDIWQDARLISTVSPTEPYSLFAGFVHLGAGLACGFTGLAAGYAIGIVGDAVRSPSLLMKRNMGSAERGGIMASGAKLTKCTLELWLLE
jgi:hypothetical protein